MEAERHTSTWCLRMQALAPLFTSFQIKASSASFPPSHALLIAHCALE